jgi:glycosyltransferase involved in cell wall biosynthesis
MRLLIVAVTRSQNSLARAYCLWLLAQELRWGATIVTPPGGDLWPPVVGTQFSRHVVTWAELRETHDVVVAVKPLLASFGVALDYCRSNNLPLLLDMDDPDWEARYGYSDWQRLRVAIAMLRRGRSPLPYQRLRREARRAPRTLSNPVLAEQWPGVVIPHVRLPYETVSPAPSKGALRVAFVGTPRGHKGLEVLRSAIAQVPGSRLSVTADPPPDARPHESWLGPTTMQESLAVLRDTDCVVIPSDDTNFARAQLPAKVIEAMIAQRAVVAYDLPPIRWAVGDTGLLVPAGAEARLVEALRRLSADPRLVVEFAQRARRRAMELFTPAAVAPAFAAAVDTALAADRARGRQTGVRAA